MLAIIRNLFKRNNSSSQLPLGRWALNNENVKSLYANSDHCGDVICGNPQKVKTFVYEENSFKHIPVTNIPHLQTQSESQQQSQQQSQPQSDDVYANQDFCCMLLGLNGPCNGCTLINSSPKINVA